MCTCITYENGGFYFGRNLDLDVSFGQTVTVTPEKFPLNFRKTKRAEKHYAMVGMASDNDAFPLYAEAVNEKGLSMAGLNFPGNAYYQKVGQGEHELASFEVIPWVLGTCASVAEAEDYLRKTEIVDLAFSEQMPPAPLHWMLADREKCIVLEPGREGLRIYDNPFGVLTNNPPFDFHRINLNNYLNLSARSPENRFSDRLNEEATISQFFHILDNVAMVRGAVVTEEGKYDITMYSCCMNADTGVYYYKTYDDGRIRAADLRDVDLQGDQLIKQNV